MKYNNIVFYESLRELISLYGNSLQESLCTSFICELKQWLPQGNLTIKASNNNKENKYNTCLLL